MTEVKVEIPAGQTWAETLKWFRDEGTKEVIPAHEIGEVRVTFRKSADKTGPVVLDKTLTRSGDLYPLELSPAETAALKKGRFYGHIKKTASSGVVSYPSLLILTVQPTTT